MVPLMFALLLAAAESPPSSPGGTGFVTQPIWLRLPNGEDMARYRPEDARVSGRAVIECKVSARGLLEFCQVLEETSGEQYGKAAVKIAARFRMGPTDRSGLATAGRKVRIPLTWTLTAPTSSPNVVQSPHWIRRPSGNDMARHYPRAAMVKGLSGRATITCRILAKGRLTDCNVIDETPVGMGFGAAAVRLAPYFQMTTTTADGQSVEGGTIRIPLVWTLPQ